MRVETVASIFAVPRVSAPGRAAFASAPVMPAAPEEKITDTLTLTRPQKPRPPYANLYDKPLRKTADKPTGEPCGICRARKYKDSSADIGVSMQSPVSIASSAAAGTILSHEREHASIAERRASEDGKAAQTNVRSRMGICPECHKVYIAGGITEVALFTPASKHAYGAPGYEPLGTLSDLRV
ncbi:MAG: hypothetical protein LBI44_03615 [Oscillospiraceae bacterium]|nr:hypothetical protein [Oscillospiraceae bacterium]